MSLNLLVEVFSTGAFMMGVPSPTVAVLFGFGFANIWLPLPVFDGTG